MGSTGLLLISLLATFGVKHSHPCPHTHEQQGNVEIKHRHIVEMGLTLLAWASMPSKFWEQAFETVVYLINRLPTPVLKNRSPYQALYHQKPDLTHFGSECFPYTCPYNNHKPELRSKSCIVLGYSLSHKGYKCFHLETGRTFISRHVIFNELSFPFSNL